jgi:hypothetical protein
MEQISPQEIARKPPNPSPDGTQSKHRNRGEGNGQQGFPRNGGGRGRTDLAAEGDALDVDRHDGAAGVPHPRRRACSLSLSSTYKCPSFTLSSCAVLAWRSSTHTRSSLSLLASPPLQGWGQAFLYLLSRSCAFLLLQPGPQLIYITLLWYSEVKRVQLVSSSLLTPVVDYRSLSSSGPASWSINY